MRSPTLLALVVSAAAAATCSSAPASKPAAPVEIPTATVPSAPPMKADARPEAEATWLSSDEEQVPAQVPDKDEKVRQCNALISIINNGIAELEHLSSSSGANDLRHMADIMDGVKAKVTQVRLTVKELREHAAAYRKMAAEVAKNARQIAAAADAKDTAKLNAAQAAMNKAVAAEDPLVDEINHFCQGL